MRFSLFVCRLLSVFLILHPVGSAVQENIGREDEGRSIQSFPAGKGYTVTSYSYNPIGLSSVLQESACFSLPFFSLVFEEIFCLCKPRGNLILNTCIKMD